MEKFGIIVRNLQPGKVMEVHRTAVKNKRTSQQLLHYRKKKGKIIFQFALLFQKRGRPNEWTWFD